MISRPEKQAAVSDATLITKATIRAAGRLGIKSKTLAKIIGVSEATVSRMRQGEHPLEPHQKPFELAVLFIRLFRSLDAMTDGDEKVAAAWLVNDNSPLGGKPVDLIQTVSGLGNVIQYLDARRALV